MIGVTNYPGTLDTPVELVEIEDQALATLGQNLLLSDVTATFASTSLLPDTGILTFGNEKVAYTSKTATQCLGLIRGYGGTPVGLHLTGDIGRILQSKELHQVHSAAIIALEERLTAGDIPANLVYAGPASGADGAPTFRALVAADIAGAGGGGGGGSLTIREVDGAPSIATATILEFLQSSGLLVTDQTGGVARVALNAIPASSLADEYQPADDTLSGLAAYNQNGFLVQTSPDNFAGRSITGVSDRTTITNGDGVSGNPSIDIAATYAGQSSITTVGTVSAGVWQGTPVALAFIGDLSATYATKAYADSLVIGLVDDRGNYDASGSVFPASGGSGILGAILKGDLWTVSVAGTLGGTAVTPGDMVRALVDTPGQTASNWAVSETNIGYVPLNSALADGAIYIGNGSGIGTAQVPSGDVTITNAGVTAIGAGKVTDAMVAGSNIVIGPASATDNAVARFDATTGKLIQNGKMILADTGYVFIEVDYTDPAAFAGCNGLEINLRSDLSANSTARFYGVDIDVATQPFGGGTNTFSMSRMGGMDFDVEYFSTGAVTTLEGITAYVYNQKSTAVTNLIGQQWWIQTDAGTTTNAYNYLAGGLQVGTGAIVTNSYGVRINRPTRSGTGSVVNNYNLYVESPVSAGIGTTLNYAVFIAGGVSHFAGTISAGSTPVTLTSAAGKVLIAAIDATGTPDGTTFLRGDGSWAAAGGTITGADTQVLFFDGANNPVGEAGLTFNKITNALSLGASINPAGSLSYYQLGSIYVQLFASNAYFRNDTDTWVYLDALSSSWAMRLDSNNAANDTLDTFGIEYRPIGSTFVRYLTGRRSGRFGLHTAIPDAFWQVNSISAATPVAIFRGAASQSANLTEWQNSAGTVLASVSAAGVLKSALPSVVVLTSGATVAVDATLRGPYRLTMGHNVTLSNPTGLSDGQVLFFEFIQPGSGGPFTLTLDTIFQLGADVSSVVLSTGADKVDIMTCIYNATAGKLRVAAFTKGY